MKKYLICVSLCLLTINLLAQDQSESAGLSLIEDFYYLIDTTKTLGIDKVQDLWSKGSFTHTEAKSIHFSIDQAAVWLAFKNPSGLNQQRFLSPGNESNVWDARLFMKDSSGIYNEIYKYNHLKKDVDHRSLYFNTLAIDLPSEGEDFLLRLYGQTNRNYSLVIGDRYSISKYLVWRERVPVAFIGFMICIFIYNSFLFLSTRMAVLIPYLIYLIMVTYAVGFHSGFVLFSTASMWPGETWYTIWMTPLYLSVGVFGLMYLNLKKTAPKLRKVILFLMVILVIVIPIVDVSQVVSLRWMARAVPVVVVLFNVFLWASGIYVWTMGVKHARFYVIGWVFIICSLLLFYLSILDIIPYSHNIDFALYFGFAAESVLFAFALGDQMNILRKEKQSLEKTYLKLTKEKNRLLAQQLFMNSHLLRAPLSRILGILGLVTGKGDKNENQELLKHMKDAALEMDGMTHKMSSILENEGYLDQYQGDFEEVKQSIYKDVDNLRKTNNLDFNKPGIDSTKRN